MRLRRFVASSFALAVVSAPTLGACTSTANINDVYMSLDSDGARRRSEFYTDSTEIHCIAEGGFGRPDVDVEGRIHQTVRYNFASNNFEDVDRYLADVDIHPEVQPGGNAPPTKIDIQLQRVDANGQPSDNAPFPAGSFVCEVLLDGQIAKTVNFNIRLALCPPAQIESNSVCLGYTTAGTDCPKYGADADQKPSCTCTPDKGWNCEAD